ncbi:MAG: penicillin amidase [Alteromonadaceae bacterium]
MWPSLQWSQLLLHCKETQEADNKSMKPGISIFRDRSGVAHVKATSLADLYWGQGFAHGTDRLMQMCLMRVLGQGRVCELLSDDDESLAIDRFFRRMNWSKNVTKELEKLNAEDHAAIESYCQGVNAALAKSYPWEFRLLGYQPDVWKPKDCLLMSRMLGYLTLAQSQGEIERLFVEMVQADISEEKLHALFPDILEGLDIELLKKVTLGERIVKPASLWNQSIPRMMASNNWVLHGSKTQSGKPMLANDPHLEANRLPNVWYEVVLIGNDRYMMGASLPGVPGVLSGRNNDVSWGVTYAFIDSIDSWVEHCESGRYFRAAKQSWHEFEVRKEVIRRKDNPSVAINCYENEHGLLDGDPNVAGYYLSTLWAANDSGVGSITTAMNMWHVENVQQAREQICKVETGWSFVMADSHGDIAFQMTGNVPIRKKDISGFVPLPGWDESNNWQGFYPPHLLPKCTNPPEGYFVTANNNLNEYGTVKPINMAMGDYRARRISQLLQETKRAKCADMYKIQFDVYSLQAELFMAILKPLLPDTSQGRILKDWDFNYDAQSQGAYLFELVLKCLYHDVFAVNGMGEKVVKYLSKESGTFVDFYANFDQQLLLETSVWFEGKTRDEIFTVAATRALKLPPKKWGKVQQITLENIFFGGNMPDMLGFDKGPLTVIGGRATVHQGQIYRSGGRQTTFMPSIRMVTDMSRHELHSNLLGGPSDRRFSKWYDSDIGAWQRGVYKLISPMPKSKQKFK